MPFQTTDENMAITKGAEERGRGEARAFRANPIASIVVKGGAYIANKSPYTLSIGSRRGVDRLVLRKIEVQNKREVGDEAHKPN